MQFLSLYTPAVPSSGPPSVEHMEKMGELIETMFKSGTLVATGGILSRQTGMKVARKTGAFSVEHGPIAGSTLMPAAGYAIMRAESREDLARNIKTFLEIAGDGTCEIIQLMDSPPVNN